MGTEILKLCLFFIYFVTLFFLSIFNQITFCYCIINSVQTSTGLIHSFLRDNSAAFQSLSLE